MSRRTLLILDDDADGAAQLRAWLADGASAAPIWETAPVAQAVEAARRVRPDAVVLTEPEFARGLGLLAALGADRIGGERLVRGGVVWLGAPADGESERRARAAGAAGYVAAVTAAEVRRAVAVALAGVPAAGAATPAAGTPVSAEAAPAAAPLWSETVAALRAALTQAREAREAAEHASRTKDEFLAIVSHELRTPLAAITGWAQLLRSGELDEAMTRTALEAIDRNARAQAQIIEDVFDVSRIVTGKLRLSPRRVPVLPIVQAALDTVRPTADKKGVALSLEPSAPPLLVLGDVERLEQVTWNLLSNAVKFTPAGGRIVARVERAGDEARIEIRDTGRGIAPDFLPFVFEQFRQEGGGTTRRQGGLGLGLAIVRYLVALHGGSTTAASPGLGLGATFTVGLPLAPAGADEAPEEPPLDEALEVSNPARPACLRGAASPGAAADATGARPSGPLTGVRVLVVEDDADTRAMLAFALGRYGAAVHAAASVPAALAHLSVAPLGAGPDVLVSDIAMPDHDGYALLAEVRAAEQRAEVAGLPILAVALTAYARPEDGARALAAGFDLHLAKPIMPSVLMRAIVQLLGPRAPLV